MSWEEVIERVVEEVEEERDEALSRAKEYEDLADEAEGEPEKLELLSMAMALKGYAKGLTRALALFEEALRR